MALFDVELYFVFQTIALEEAINRCDIVIILMLGWFLWLWLDQDRTLKANLVLVLHHEIEEATHIVELTAQIGVEQGFITFATTPKHIIVTPEALGCVEAGFDRGSCKSKHFRIRIGRSTRHVAAMREEIGCAPQKLDAGFGLLLLKNVDDSFEILGVLHEVIAFRAHVGVMEAIERRAEQ